MISSGAPVASVVRRLASEKKRSSWIEKNTMQASIVPTIPNCEQSRPSGGATPAAGRRGRGCAAGRLGRPAWRR